MTDPTASARDDLAFIRGLVQDGGKIQASTGAGLFAGGLCFGIQCVAQSLLLLVPVGFPGRDLSQLVAGIAPSLVFTVILIILMRRDKRRKVGDGESVAARAFKAAFGAAGLSILTTAVVFGYIAFRERDLNIWLLHPIMVCVAQGVGWYVAYAIRRTRWYAWVSAGWFVCAPVLAVVLPNIAAFLLVLGVALFGLMAVPGWKLRRAADG